MKDIKILSGEINSINVDIAKLEKELREKIKERDNKRRELKATILINRKDELSENSIMDIVKIEDIESFIF